VSQITFYRSVRASDRRSVASAIVLCLSRCRKNLCILDLILRRNSLPNLHVHFCIRRFSPSPSASSPAEIMRFRSLTALISDCSYRNPSFTTRQISNPWYRAVGSSWFLNVVFVLYTVEIRSCTNHDTTVRVF